MPNILIFGNGYIGRHLFDRLNSRGHQVVIASRNGTGDCRKADLSSPASINSLASGLAKKNFIPSRIVHCASTSRGGVDAYRLVFCDGMQHLITNFPGALKIFTSSTSVYPQIDGGVVTEESPANPEQATAKYLREAEEQLLANEGIVLRLAGIYGPGRSIHLKRILNGSARIEKGERSRWLNQIHRDDATDAIIHVIESVEPGKQIYNVADDHPVTQRECYEAMAEILGLPTPEEAEPVKNGKRAWTNKQVSNAKLKATGWQPGFPSFPGAIEVDQRILESIRKQVEKI